MTNRISNAIDVFLNAIKKGTLASGNCYACAVGNLVASGMGVKLISNLVASGIGVKLIKIICNINDEVDNSNWSKLFSTFGGIQTIYYKELDNLDVKQSIEATEFTWEELAKIEFAFEINTKIRFAAYALFTDEEIRKDQVKGLEAVIQVMLDFDDCKDKVQEVFTSKVELIPV